MLRLKQYATLVMTLFAIFYLILSVYLSLTVDSVQAKNKVSLFPGQGHLSKILDINGKKCTEERTNFVFIKCMKCATETMGSILRRFGYVRNLNFVLPVKRNIYLGWPFPIELSDFRRSKFEYNILMEHSIYNRSFMQKMMPNNTLYVTMIRHPWSHFKSAYNYFSVGEIANVPNKSIQIYLKNISYYESVYKSPEKKARRHCIPDNFSITRNLQSHCLGIPLGFPLGREDLSSNDIKIYDYIRHIEEAFTLVMIVDHFVESLVLLKRTLCWSFKDIVYHHSNIGRYEDIKLKVLKPESEILKIHRNWSHVDYVLFDHFNKSLWLKIKNEGPEFYMEVQQFRLTQMFVERFCFIENMWRFPNESITIPESRFNKAFNVTGEDCVLMNVYMLPLLWAKYYEREGISPEAFGDAQNRPKPLKGCSI